MVDNALKWGITTGSCAALGAKAAAMLLTGEVVEHVDIPLPGGSRLDYPAVVCYADDTATATVIKDAGDDPDVTDGTAIVVTVKRNELGEIRFFAGVGVGTVTKAGLAIPQGEAAINPIPRQMIRGALAEVADCGFDVTVAVPAGVELAKKTFNPRLGIVGGISILGTSGRVRPFSAPALREGLKCALDVAVAAKIKNLVLVPGNMGNKAAQHYFTVRREQIVDVSNEWGFMLGEAEKHPFEQLLVVGHPGKLAKLARGQWQTHSAQSESAVAYVSELAAEIVSAPLAVANTVEELFMEFLDENQRIELGDRIAGEIRQKMKQKYPNLPAIAVVLINLKRQIIGRAGDFTLWSKR